MPEGDTVLLAAQRVRAALEGRRLTGLDLLCRRWPRRSAGGDNPTSNRPVSSVVGVPART